MAENIERIFQDDIRDKRKAGSGSFHRKGHGIKHGIGGALRTPSFFMKTKEKKKLDGEVETYNMYTTILNWTEFEQKDREIQKMLLTKWREIYPNQKIMDELSVGTNKHFNAQSFADLVNGLGCPPKIRGGSKPRKERQASIAIATATEEKELQTIPTATKEIQQPVKLITNGLHLEYNGDYDAEQLSKIFTRLQLITDGEENKYTLSISLTERA